jgi:hypothetical protein
VHFASRYPALLPLLFQEARKSVGAT